MTPRPALTLAILGLPLVAGCAYYNRMWSAERLAREARRQEANGLQAQARINWGLAAAKAESVLVRHPRSRWADDALVLQGEALARSGACAAAGDPLERALGAEIGRASCRERVYVLV